MIINHNMSSIYANRQLSVVDSNIQSNIEKLSSGLRITRGGDDPSGLAVSEKMRAQIRGLNQANRNTLDGVSFLQATEGYLEETTNILQRIRQLSVQAANGIYSDEDRLMLQVEVSQLIDEVNRIASHAQFNGMNLLLGDFAQSDTAPRVMAIHFGANAKIHVRAVFTPAGRADIAGGNYFVILDDDRAVPPAKAGASLSNNFG